MKVWLDDVREMPSSFDHHARTVSVAICLLATGTVQRISLDHDLGDAENGTGYELAKWLSPPVVDDCWGLWEWRLSSEELEEVRRLIAERSNSLYETARLKCRGDKSE